MDKVDLYYLEQESIGFNKLKFKAAERGDYETALELCIAERDALLKILKEKRNKEKETDDGDNWKLE